MSNCINFNLPKELLTNGNHFIGYSYNDLRFVNAVRICALISTLFSFLKVIKHIIKNWKIKSSTLEDFILVMKVCTFFISGYYIIITFAYSDASSTGNNCSLAYFISIMGVFLNVFMLFFTSLSIKQLQLMINEPIDGILKAKLKFKLSLIYSLLFSLIVSVLIYSFNLYGYSPMLTPGIMTFTYNNDEHGSILKIVIVILCYIFLLIKILLGLLSVYFSKRFRKDHDIMTIFMRFTQFAVIFILCKIPYSILMLFSISVPYYESGSNLANLSAVSLFLLCIEGTILIVYRSINKLIVKLFFSKKQEDENSKLHNLEVNIIQNLIANIFIGVNYCFNKSFKEDKVKDINVFTKEDYYKTTTYNIESNDTFMQKFSHKLYLPFIINEHSPKVMKYLRDIDDLDQSYLFESFNPDLNKQNIENSKGKGGSFFLSTFNSQFILKTIKRDELDTITNIMLKKYTRHMKRVKGSFGSLLCPIYGLFSIEYTKGNHLYFIIMRNMYGPYSKMVEKQYDLKGSTINRIELISLESNLSDLTLKDLNFNDLEKYFDLDEESTKRLQNQIEDDSFMLSEMNIIDYSLFVVVINLNKNVLLGNLLKAFGKKLLKDKMKNEKKQEESSNKNKDKEENILDKEEKPKFNFLSKISKVTHDDSSSSSYKMSNNIVSNTLIGQEDSYKFYKKFIFVSRCTTKAYIISVIDYFQYYNLLKTLETNYKHFVTNRSESIEAISCVPPELYYERFVQYINSLTYDYENEEIKENQQNEYSKLIA